MQVLKPLKSACLRRCAKTTHIPQMKLNSDKAFDQRRRAVAALRQAFTEFKDSGYSSEFVFSNKLDRCIIVQMAKAVMGENIVVMWRDPNSFSLRKG